MASLRLSVLAHTDLPPGAWAAIRALCDRAYAEELTALYGTFLNPTHVLAHLDDALVCHAMWVERRLQPEGLPPLRTAYVELVATEPAYQRRGFATAVMQRLAEAIAGYELGALCPAVPELYERLGWQYWRGPLSIRTASGALATPHEVVMVMVLAKTPPLDFDAPMSAEWRDGELW